MNSLDNAIKDHTRDFRNNTYVYPVISRRSGGISIGVNLNIDKRCNFSCVYCQVDRTVEKKQPEFDIALLEHELEEILGLYRSGALGEFPQFKDVDPSRKVLKDIALSGDGEATTRPEFEDVCRLLNSVQKKYAELAIKLVCISNATMFKRESVQAGLDLLCETDGEIWAKLDAGTQNWFEIQDRGSFKLNTIVDNISFAASFYPVQIQTMICKVNGKTFDIPELGAYIAHIHQIMALNPNNVKGIQLYSVARQTTEEYCRAADIAFLYSIKDRVEREVKGLKVTVY